MNQVKQVYQHISIQYGYYQNVICIEDFERFLNKRKFQVLPLNKIIYFSNRTSLKDYDPFQQSKEDSFTSALPVIKQMAKYMLLLITRPDEGNKGDFINLLKVSMHCLS